MSQHPTLLQNSHSPGRREVQGQRFTPLLITSNIYYRQILCFHIQRSLRPPMCAVIQCGQPSYVMKQLSMTFLISHGQTFILLLIYPQQNHYLLRSGRIRTSSHKYNPTVQYYSLPNAILYTKSMEKPNRNHHLCQIDGHRYKILYLPFPRQHDINTGYGKR